MDPIWTPYEVHIGSIWNSEDVQMGSRSGPDGVHIESIWRFYRVHMGSKRIPTGAKKGSRGGLEGS